MVSDVDTQGVIIAPDPTQLDEAERLSVVCDPVFYPDVIISFTC